MKKRRNKNGSDEEIVKLAPIPKVLIIIDTLSILNQYYWYHLAKYWNYFR